MVKSLGVGENIIPGGIIHFVWMCFSKEGKGV